VEIQHPLIGEEILFSNPFRLKDTPPDVRRHAPSIGEHNGYVLGELLATLKVILKTSLKKNHILEP